MAREPGLGAADRLVAVTTLSFDIAVLELLLPLWVGAQVVLASREQAGDGHALRELIESSAATVMQATPATWRMLIEAGWRGSPGFKALIGGEALPPDLAAQLLERTGELWNMYGPTETTVWSTCWRVQAPQDGISIGRPIANTSVWILDENRQMCPIGVPGEIYIGGEGVTLGYLNRPELTAERFVADPFSEVPGARLYRTGDRGRWRANGLLEHMGRLDFQVKVRGYRIELGEIESALGAHEGVGRCVVITREDEPGDVRLVAYVVPRGEMPAAGSLREHLKAGLPDYMVPQHFVQLEAIPLLPNGKIDRKALPRPVDSGHAAAAGFEAPVTPAEVALARIWSEVLRVDRVSATDNFFDLGGHSLLVMRVIVGMEKEEGLKLNPRQFVFESLRQIAAGATPMSEAVDTGRAPGALRKLLQSLGIGAGR
jgi:acyl-coenzyme A synthetase/AMP-(fatty) acid ligase/acyl carrier protein